MTLALTTCVAAALALLQPQTSQSGFELDLPLKRELLKKAQTIVQADETTIFIPGGRGPSGDLRLEQGPVARVKARSGTRGLAITLQPRDSFAASGQPTVHLHPKGVLRVGQLHVASTDAGKTLGHDVSAEGKNLATDKEGLGWDPRQRKQTKAAAASQPLAARLWPAGIGLVGFLGAAGWLLRRRRGDVAKSSNTIAVVAARSLGSRHKLAVVEVDGERLLLAMSDREVSLISHLAPTDGAMAAAASASTSRRFALPKGPASAVAADAAALPVPAPPAAAHATLGAMAAPLSSDVAGLLHLRQPPPSEASLGHGAST
jgi:flagellar biogenesis protein FliO